MLPCTAARIHGPALRLGYTALRCGHDSRGWLLTRLNIKKIGVKLISFSIIENKNVVHVLVEGRGGAGGGGGQILLPRKIPNISSFYSLKNSENS